MGGRACLKGSNGSSMVDPFVPMRGTPGIRGRGGTGERGVQQNRTLGTAGHKTSTQVRGDHGSECPLLMQGQMHVHVPDLSNPVVIVAHFFPRPISELDHFRNRLSTG
ncbi:hypothetical protein GCM10010394_52200 [Streptomyces crystallinus]|uniref:Uncharacterized protein n=1 Tax=Streptomyces crystallinus TaxID=68191 RepID=A0ABP3RSQ5_9ACTN